MIRICRVGISWEGGCHRSEARQHDALRVAATLHEADASTLIRFMGAIGFVVSETFKDGEFFSSRRIFIEAVDEGRVFLFVIGLNLLDLRCGKEAFRVEGRSNGDHLMASM